MAVDDPRELDRLRRELQSRLEFRPARHWSARLLAAMIAVFDLEFGELVEPPAGRPKLSVVGSTVRP